MILVVSRRYTGRDMGGMEKGRMARANAAPSPLQTTNLLGGTTTPPNRVRCSLGGLVMNSIDIVVKSV